MPGVSRTHRAEAKYNVTLDFPNLGLHSAASSGNLGLVTYALDHGQPVNSVIDGVLPLHVASSGGNVLIVELLIKRGADVNAPRLPRKYSSDRHRDASAPIVGTSGATPLHFAAANGHEEVILTLLNSGATPDRPDKHGVTAESLARQNGWTRCAQILSQWTHDKDRDLREREALAPESETSRLEGFECRVFEKKLKVKRSIDNAFNMLRAAPDAAYTTSPPPVDYLPEANASPEFPARRPSLPHIFDPALHAHAHTHSHGSTNQYLSKPSGRPSARRPRSAGTDAEPSAMTTATSASSTPGRLRGKISLLHMFKKTTGDPATSTPATPESRDSFSASSSASASPAPDRERGGSRGSSAHSPLRTRASESVLASDSPNPTVLSTVPSSRSRLASESRSSSNSESSYPPLAVELHRKLSMERSRTRSGSGSSANVNPTEMPAKAQSPLPQHPPLPQLQGHRSPPVRPGILRTHNRSASSGQSQLQPPSLQADARSLRFDSSSTAGTSVSTKRSALNLERPSMSSLRGETQQQNDSARPRSPWSTSSQQRLRDVDGAENTQTDHRDATAIDDDDEEGYGEVISPRLGLGLGLAPDGKSRIEELKSELQRRPSAGSQLSRQSSMSSSIPSPTTDSPRSGFDCPFSINRPPVQPLPADQPQSCDSRPNLLGIHGVDNRMRGDSFGSMSTSTDASMPQTPYPGPGLGLQIRSPDAGSLDLPLDLEDEKSRSRANSSASGAGYFAERERSYSHNSTHPRHESRNTSRSRTMSPSRIRAPPLDIDIRAISSHAQAEALVQRAQKSILDMEDVDIELPGFGILGGSAGGQGSAGAQHSNTSGSGSANGNGRTPLSAKLAAYGESLAIERRFREKGDRRDSNELASASAYGSLNGETPIGSPITPNQGKGQLRTRRSELGPRKYSLDERPEIVLAPAPRRKQRRPHTADGETSESSSGFLSPHHRQTSPSHKQSLSSSALISSRSSPTEKSTLSRPPPSSRTVPLLAPTSASTRAPRIVRSRTPDPDFDMPSPISPSDVNSFGVPLSRVSTAPPRHASPDIIAQRSISDRERERARANKLTKMGLPTFDSFPRSHSPYGHARNGGGSGGSGVGTLGGAKHKLGGIRGFVQTLKGKS